MQTEGILREGAMTEQATLGKTLVKVSNKQVIITYIITYILLT